MLGQPALLARHVGGDPQRKAFLPEQGVAAVTGAEGPDFACFGVVDDVLGGIARPAHVVLTSGEWCSDGVHAGHESPVLTQRLERSSPHAGHGAHVDGDVGAVSDLDANVRDGTADGPH